MSATPAPVGTSQLQSMRRGCVVHLCCLCCTPPGPLIGDSLVAVTDREMENRLELCRQEDEHSFLLRGL